MIVMNTHHVVCHGAGDLFSSLHMTGFDACLCAAVFAESSSHDPSSASSVQLTSRSKAASQRSIAVAATAPAAGEQQAAAKVEAPPRRLVTAVRERVHEKVAVPFVPVQLVCKDLRYYVPGGGV